MHLETIAVTVTGRRPHNEDAVSARPELGLFIVADGMGGYEGGEVASRIAVEAIEALVATTAGDRDVTWPFHPRSRVDPVASEIEVATRYADARIVAAKVGPLQRMGSTVAVLRVDLARGLAVIGHVGDSRVYRLRDGGLAQLTTDHSLWEQLVAAGAAPVDRADFPYRNVITRALGTAEAVPDLRVERIVVGDVFLLCSDGLTEGIDDDRLAATLAGPVAVAGPALVEAAYAGGSRDNISAVVVRVAA